MIHIKWPSIESLRSVAHNSAGRGRVHYCGKIKLHGTNAAIQIGPDGQIAAQSRTRILTPDDDNYGFAAWLETAKPIFTEHDRNCVYFGEWCGPGVQRGVALSKLDRKVFAIYAVQHGDSIITEPEMIGRIAVHPDIFVLPWLGEHFEIDFFGIKPETVDSLNAAVQEVETCDPWVYQTFGIKGTGEGIVYYPTSESGWGTTLSADDMSPDYLGRRVFKAKGEGHRVNGHAEAVSIKAAILEGVPEFVAFAVTEARLKQALSEVCPEFPTMQKTPDFLRWIQSDIQKECAEELAALGCDPKKAMGACGSRAVQWLKLQCGA